MKRFLLSICCLLAPFALPAQSLENARLFDWFYPSESAYQALNAAARQLGHKGWIVSMMQQGQPIPQASARELALDLEFDPRVSAEIKASLQSYFAPESAGVSTSGKGTEGRDISKLEGQFVLLNERMNELEAIVKKNSYNKQTFPSVSLSVRAAAVNSGGSGLLMGTSDNHFTGGFNVHFDGQGDAGGFGFEIAESIDHGGLFIPSPVVYQHGSVGWSAPSFQIGYQDATFTISLGGGHTLQRSALVLGAVAAPGAPNSFIVDLEGGTNRPLYDTAELKLGLPFGGGWLPNLIYTSKQGTAAYWPFSFAEIFYGPEQGFFAGYNGTKRYVWGTDAELETGNLWGLLDHNIVYGAVTGAFNDKDQLRSFQLADNPAGSLGWAVGTDSLFSWGGELFMEYGQASRFSTNNGYPFNTPAKRAQIEGYPGSSVLTGYERYLADQAYVMAYTHPLGIFTFGLEYSRIGPYFFPDLGAISSMLVTGDNSDPASPTAGGGVITPWFKAPTPAGHYENGKIIVDKTQDVTWGTNASDAAGLVNNTEKVVLQGQVSWSWLSLAAFSGVAAQIEPSGPWLKTKPGFESGGGPGFLLYNRFGGSYWLPPAPLSTAPGQTLTDGTANFAYYQWLFNRPADGNALDSTGATQAVHWNDLAQFAYQRLDYYVLFSKKGVGDPHIDGFSQKFTNYLATTFKLDFQSLLGRLYPAELQLFGLTSDVAPQPGVPTFGNIGPAGAENQPYFTQIYTSAFARYGVSAELTLVGIYGHEEWKSNHSYFPIATALNEYGLGFDLDAAKLLSGLGFFARSRILYFEDHNIAQRKFNVWETSIGTNLNF